MKEQCKPKLKFLNQAKEANAVRIIRTKKKQQSKRKKECKEEKKYSKKIFKK